MSRLKQVIAALILYALACFYLDPLEACEYVSIEPLVIKTYGVK